MPIQVITGCMWSGKTEELVRRLKRYILAKKPVYRFELKKNSRKKRGVATLKSQKLKIPRAIRIKTPLEILQWTRRRKTKKRGVIAIDEVQFFHTKNEIKEFMEVLENLSRHWTIIVTGLDTDFLHRPFGVMPYVMAIADRVSKLTAICTECGESATHTQRLINGGPAPPDSPLILVGDKESYEPRCRKCFKIAKPSN